MTPADPATSPAAEALRLDAVLVARLEAVRDRELAARRAEVARIAPEAETLVDRLTEYLDGGKLLRPRFAFHAAVAALGREPEDAELGSLARIGTAIELVQAAALMHDDVIDHSETRRGRPALHVAEAADHRAQGWAGSAEDFGAATAIVLGDLTLTWAEQLAATAGLTGSGRAEFEALRSEVMVGQYLDVLHQAGGFASPASAEEAALAVIRWKTVPYTTQRPVRIGAAGVGAPAAVVDGLDAWAVEVGTAFQLRDDLLSVAGDTDATGKPLGGDVTEGKRTVLLARTEEASDAAGRALLDRVVGDPDASPEDVAAVQRLMVDTGAVASVAAQVQEQSGSATAMLADLPGLGETGRAGLQALADRATDVREFLDPRG